MRIWEKVKDETIVKDKFINIESTTWRMPNGNIVDKFYHYTKRNGVSIIAIDKDNNYILIKQFRPGVNKITTEMPAGTVNDDEDVQSTAARELLEETGYTSNKWTNLGYFSKNVFMTNDTEYLFIAEECTKIAEPVKFATEEQEGMVVDRATLEQLIKNNEFDHAEHIVALYKFENHLFE